MSKRTPGLELRENGAYFTPEAPILSLTPFLAPCIQFAEPMCGDGAIINVLERMGWLCLWASDINPAVEGAETLDVLDLTEEHVDQCTHIISNPPWPLPPNKLMGHEQGWPTIPIIRHCMALRPSWFILAADFAHNRYAPAVLKYCPKIVSVGRVSWMHNGKKGFDNAAWYLFDAKHKGPTEFIGNEYRQPTTGDHDEDLI